MVVLPRWWYYLDDAKSRTRYECYGVRGTGGSVLAYLQKRLELKDEGGHGKRLIVEIDL